MPNNELYLAILPMMRVPHSGLAGLAGIRSSKSVEQFITLFPDRNLATEFFPDEVQVYIDAFDANKSSLTGGHVLGYHVATELTDDGRVVVKVVQHVV